MKKSDLLAIIEELGSSPTEPEIERIMEAYHRLDNLNQPHLGEMIDGYILGELDERRKRLLDVHLPRCESCRKRLEVMRTLIGGIKDLGEEIF